MGDSIDLLNGSFHEIQTKNTETTKHLRMRIVDLTHQLNNERLYHSNKVAEMKHFYNTKLKASSFNAERLKAKEADCALVLEERKRRLLYLEQQLKDQQAELNTLSQVELERALDTAHKREDYLLKQNERLTHEFAQLQADHHDSQAAEEALRTENKQLTDKIRVLQSQADAFDATKLSESYQRCLERLSEAEKECEELQDRLLIRTISIEMRDDQVEQQLIKHLTSEVDRLNQELKEASARAAELEDIEIVATNIKDANEIANSLIKELTDELAMYKDQLTEAEKQLEAIKHRLADAEDSLAGAKEDLADTNLRLANSQRDYEDKQQECEAISRDLDELAGNYDATNTELKLTLQELEDAKYESEDLRQELGELRVELEETYRDLEVAKEQSDSQHEDLVSQLNEARNDLGETKKQIETLKGQCKDLSEQHDETQKQLEAARGQLEDMGERYYEAQQQLESTNGQLEELEVQHDETMKQLEFTKGQLEELTDQYYEIKDRYGDAQAELDNTSEQLQATRSQLKATETQFTNTHTLLQHTTAQLEETSDHFRATIMQLDATKAKLKDTEAKHLQTKKELENIDLQKVALSSLLHTEKQQVDCQREQLGMQTEDLLGTLETLTHVKQKLTDLHWKHTRSNTEDEVDNMLKAYLKKLGYKNFIKVDSGTYRFGNKRVSVAIKNGVLVIRVGGGYMLIEEFLHLHSPEKFPRERSDSPSSCVTPRRFKQMRSTSIANDVRSKASVMVFLEEPSENVLDFTTDSRHDNSEVQGVGVTTPTVSSLGKRRLKSPQHSLFRSVKSPN